MRNFIVGGIASLVLTAGCFSLSDSRTQSEIEGDEGEADNDDCKLEGSQIGREGAELQLGSTTVRFHDWVSKPGEAGEYLGFSLTIDGTPYDHFIVKAGTQKYIGDGTGWMHPAGANAAAISNVDFCECEPPPPSCDNPDGCGDGGGGDGDGTIL